MREYAHVCVCVCKVLVFDKMSSVRKAFFLKGIIDITVRDNEKNNGHIHLTKFLMDNDNNSAEGVIIRSLNAKRLLLDAITCLCYSVSRHFDAIHDLVWNHTNNFPCVIIATVFETHVGEVRGNEVFAAWHAKKASINLKLHKLLQKKPIHICLDTSKDNSRERLYEASYVSTMTHWHSTRVGGNKCKVVCSVNQQNEVTDNEVNVQHCGQNMRFSLVNSHTTFVCATVMRTSLLQSMPCTRQSHV